MENIKIRGQTYVGMDTVSIPKADGSGDAEFVLPEGEEEITENGEYDVTRKKTARVNVQASGTDDYTALSNKPAINGHTLEGDQTPSQLGLVAAQQGAGLITDEELQQIQTNADDIAEAQTEIGKKYTKPSGGIPASDLAAGVIPTKTSELQNDSGFLENSLAIVQAPPAVGSMLKVAESYFEQAYGENTHLVYESGHGLFAPSTTSSVEGEEGYHAIVCSQFAQALMKGISFAQSRYVLPNNHISGWGFTTDGTGTYVDFGEPVNDDASKDYMDAKHQLKYAIDHGWAYEISDVREQVKPGDFVFYGLSNVSSWEDVTHVALVLHVGLDEGYMINIESDDKTVNGKRVGVVVKRFPIEKSGGHYLYGARFPVFDGASPAMFGGKILEDSALAGTNTAYMIKQYDTPETMPAGFYTAIIDGDFAASRVEIGIRYADAAANTFDYSNGRMVKNAGRYAVTFYAAKPFVQVRIGATANNAYNINHWALFKGYYGQDWNLDTDVPTAEEVGAVAANQGTANAGKFMVVGSDGIIAPVTMQTWQGGSY